MDKWEDGVMTTNDIDKEALRDSCVSLLETIYQSYPEGLEEAVEVLARIVEFHKQCEEDAKKPRISSIPRELKPIRGVLLPAKSAPPIVLEFD